MSYIYLAGPYSDPDLKIRYSRFQKACRVAYDLMKQGKIVFSPVAHSHSIEWESFKEIETGDFWLNQDLKFLEHATCLLVLKLPGWEKSEGVGREVKFAKERGIPIEYMQYE